MGREKLLCGEARSSSSRGAHGDRDRSVPIPRAALGLLSSRGPQLQDSAGLWPKLLLTRRCLSQDTTEDIT